MTVRQALAELRAEIPNLKKLAIPDVDDAALRVALDFTDALVEATQRIGHSPDHTFKYHEDCDVCGVLALLDREVNNAE